MVLYLNSTHKIKITGLFSYELAPTLIALFIETGEGRYPTSKANLKDVLKVELSMRNIIPEATLIDGCATMHSILYWSKGGKVYDLLVTLISYVTKILSQPDVISYLTVQRSVLDQIQDRKDYLNSNDHKI